MAKLTSKHLDKLNKSYKKIFKESGCRILSDDEMLNIEDSMSLLSSSDVKIIKAAQSGNYATFNDASPLVRNYVGTLAWKKFVSEVNISSSSLSLNNEQVKKYIQDHVLDAGFRVGLSAMKHSSPDNDALKELDEYANEYILAQTLSVPSQERVNALSARVGEKAAQKELEKNAAQQVVFAKTLFLAQLGKYTLKEGDQTTDYVGSIAETFAHGGRTNFILPFNDVNNEVIAAFDGEVGKTAELKSRIAATHSATQRKVGADLSVEEESNEEKPKYSQVRKIFSNQYGMNVAMGGIGNMGPNQKAILTDGSAGHVYICKQAGKGNVCGSFLIGVESAASLTTSNTGHFHTPLAKSSKQSAFLSDKFGPGNKTDGKTVDLSGLEPKTLATMLRTFENSYMNLQKNNPEVLNNVNELLAGKRLSENELISLMTNMLNMEQDYVKEAVSDARKGLEASVQRETNDLAIKFKNVLGLDLHKQSTVESVKVMQKTTDNKWILTNLFDQNDTPEQRFSKFAQSAQKGEQLYLISNSKVNPTKININQKRISLGENVERFESATPKEPSGLKKALHRMTRGLLFGSAMKQYEEQKQAAEQQLVLNAFIDQHKVVVEQFQREARSQEGQSLFRAELSKRLQERIVNETSTPIKESVSKEHNSLQH